jgi:hypothetical protein
VIVTSGFECGNGKDIEQIADRRWRVVEQGDRETYCYYFTVEVKAESPDEAGDVMIEIFGDPDLKTPEGDDVGTRGLMGHCPCTIWVSRWEQFHPLPMKHVDFLDDRIVIRLKVPADRPVRVTNVIPSSYTDTVAFLKECAGRMPANAEFIEAGKSHEGRALPGIRVTEGLKTGGRPRLVVFSGQHPIEFPGVFGSRGIADFLTSGLAEAADLRGRYDVVVLPLVNPDGTVHGRNNFNAKGEDVYSGFEGASEGKTPTIPESRALWEFRQQPVPAMMLNIHCYCSLAVFVEPPYNGMYILRDEAFTDENVKRRQRVIDDYVRFKTSGLTGHSRPSQMGPNGVNHQMMLAHGTFSNLFEINAATHGPFGAGREAIQCFRAMIEGYEEATKDKAEG